MQLTKIIRRSFGSLCCGALLLTSCTPSVKEQPVENQEEVTVQENLRYGIPQDSFRIETFTIKQGENLSTILAGLGFSAQTTDRIGTQYKEILDPTKLRAGSKYETFLSTDSVPAIKYLVFEKSQTDFAVIDFSTDSLNVYPYTKEISLKRKFASGKIESSLWEAIRKGGGDPLLALKLSDVYAWQIDFFDTKKGDSFAVVYNEAYIDDTTALYVHSIESAVFDHAGKEYKAIPFTQDDVIEYFDEQGKSLRKAFLKAPLDFFRITSRFTNARFHPVLKRYRAHHGVDYAAPTGTPVKSIGAGKVIAKGFQARGGGNFIKVKHNGTYTTSYMHLSRFAKSLQVGSSVQQGQVIGYVGSTGLSTGPHLDFRVYKDGKPINPLNMEAPSSLPVKEEYKNEFLAVKNVLLNELDSCRSTIPMNEHIEIHRFENITQIRKETKESSKS
ncbi:MAG: peptidoglycan DD-metalloendopeptidase family protein [Bacteroidales bacterium]